MRNRVPFLAALGTLALLAGCGSSSSSTTATGASGASGATGASGSTPLSQDEFVAQANAACKGVNDKVAALPKPTTYAEAITVSAKELAYVKVGEAALHQITPPTDQQAEYNKFLAAVDAQTPLAEKLVAALKAHDSSAAKAIGKQLQANSPDSIAKSLGLTECAKNVSPSG